MPRYDYKCLKCEEISTIRHSIKEVKEICPACGEGKLLKLVSLPYVVEKQTAGKVVHDHIEETKKSIQEEKDKMKEEWK